MVGPLPVLLRRLPRLRGMLPAWPRVRSRLGRRAFLRGSPLVLVRLRPARESAASRIARLDEAVARLSQEKLPRRELFRQAAQFLVRAPGGLKPRALAAAGDGNGVAR